MTLPETKCDPYKTLLEAGRLRSEAGKIATRADYLESAARTELDLDASASVTNVVVPGSVLCIAYGGKADGQQQRIPVPKLSGAVELGVADVSAEGAGVTYHEYMPAMIIDLLGQVVGALLVPRGRRVPFFSKLASEGVGGDASAVLAKLLHQTVGFNTEMIHGVTETFVRTAQSAEEMADAPMYMRLGGH